MFRIEMLPAAHGDCLWIEYGTGSEVHRILIDGGPAHTYPALRERILHLPEDDRVFELLVVTHIDGDHIEGVVRLLQDAEVLKCRFERIWFNGRDQLNAVPDPAGEPLGALQGEFLGLLIADYEARVGKPVWNAGLPSALAAIDRKAGALPVVELGGNCRLTLLSPDHERLLELKDEWREALEEAGVKSGDEAALRSLLEAARNLRPLGDVLGEEEEELSAAAEDGRYEVPDPLGRDLAQDLDDTLGRSDGEAGADAAFGGDKSPANGSSIALLLEYPKDAPKVRFLLAGDAWPSVLEASIDQLLSGRGGRLALTGFKLAHHGSVANVSETLLAKLRCQHYMVSTSGAVFRHPHARAIDLLLGSHAAAGKPLLHFNYLTATTARWSDAADQKARGYEAFHPKGLSLAL
ncbi:MAG: hypothetical protein J0M28_07490 [Thauera sp.]|nr:hypothetical protein [Thauera sp.]